MRGEADGYRSYDLETRKSPTFPPTLRPPWSIRPPMPIIASMIAYRWLRANNPLGIARPERFDPFWVVTKHAHIQAVSRQNELFHNADRPTTLTIEGGRGARPQDHRRAQPGALAGADGCARSSEIPRADAGLVHAGQSRKVRGRGCARSRAPPCERMLAQGGACDFVADVALGYPLHVIMEILGVPGKGRAAHAQADAGAVRSAGSRHGADQGALTRGTVRRDDAGGGGRFRRLFRGDHRGPPRATRATISPP